MHDYWSSFLHFICRKQCCSSCTSLLYNLSSLRHSRSLSGTQYQQACGGRLRLKMLNGMRKAFSPVTQSSCTSTAMLGRGTQTLIWSTPVIKPTNTVFTLDTTTSATAEGCVHWMWQNCNLQIICSMCQASVYCWRFVICISPHSM